MKNVILIFLTLSLVGILSGEMAVNDIDNGLVISYENYGLSDQQQELTKIFAIPSESVNITVNSCEVKTLNEAGMVLETRTINGSNKVELMEDFIMRDLRGHTIRIKLSSRTAF